MSLAARAAARGVATWYTDQAGRRVTVPEETVVRVLEALGDPVDPPPVEDAPRCPRPPRSWGWMAQAYAVRSRRSWGMGDFADLAALARWSGAECGAAFVLVNPLHAVAPGLPQEPSPYFPASRRFVNPLYLAVEDVPDAALVPEALRLGEEARALNTSALIDRDAVWQAKSPALERLFAGGRSRHGRAFAEYRAAQGAALEDFAVWCAVAERHRGPYQDWPAEYRRPDAAGTRAAREGLAERVTYHAWLQWLCAEQLAEAQRGAREAGMAVGLVHDLAVGCDPGGADAWAQQDLLAPGMTVGAPPDAYNADGQDWRLPPWRPDALRATAYAPFRDLVRATLAHAGGIRVDHAMGLWRLFWIPEGMSPREGTYVRYDADALLATLCREAVAAEAVVVAEDLGTVEPQVPRALRDRGILGSSVLWFGDDWPELSFASVTTHDLPTAYGVFAEQTDLAARVRRLVGGRTPDETVVAMHAYVARTPSLLAGVMLGDAVGDPRRVNRPGTRDEYPNWRLPLPVDLDDLGGNERLRAVVAAVRTARSPAPGAR